MFNNSNWRYASYVIRHKYFVLLAGLKTRAPLWRLIIHDWTKLTRAEWPAYVEFFHGPQPASTDAMAAFQKAWTHHWQHNAHHWQYWLHPFEGFPYEIPEPVVRELVADWAAAGRAINGKWEVRTWYTEHKDSIELHHKTRARVEELLLVI